MRQDRGAGPILLGIAGVALLTAMDAMAKWLSPRYPTIQLVGMRYIVTAALLLPVAMWLRTGFPSPSRLHIHASRAALMLSSSFLFFYAIGRLPLAETFVLSFTAPLFMVIFGTMLLREPLKLVILGAVVMGFAGVLVVVLGEPGTGATGMSRDAWAVAAAVLCAVSYALGIILLRAQSAHEPLVLIVLTQATMAGVTALLLSVPTWRWPIASDIPVILSVGTLGAIGHMMVAGAVSRVTAARYSSVEYTSLLWAAIIGYVVFAEIPGWNLWVGAALIAGACAIVLRERSQAPTGAPKIVSEQASALPAGQQDRP